MIGLDTNVLVRYLVQDDPVQALRATEVIEQRLTEDNPGFISAVAAAETAWVLRRAYRFGNRDIAAAVERMMRSDAFVLDRQEEVFAAVAAVQQGGGNFADALIGALGARAGCAHTLTFDRKALRLPWFAAA